MKLTLNLTYEDGLKVIEAVKNVATEYGWDDEEMAEWGLIKEYTSAVDAALAAMGISISIAGEPEIKVEENDFDDEEWDEDEEDGYFNFDEEENDDDTTTYSLTAKGEFVLRYMEAGHTFEEAYKIATLLFGDGE